MPNFSPLITKWYRQNKRELPWREINDPYLIWLSEIILQQTRVEQGRSYFEKFKTNYPTITDLANAEERDVLNDWQGLGYYSRARNLHFSAKMVRDEHDGNFPTTFKEILKLKGVGKYTAAAISSFAFKEKQAVVDGNVYRLLSRVFEIYTPIDSTHGQKEFQELADELISDDEPDIHNQAIMEMGAVICTPKNPDCDICPLNEMCLAKANNTIDLLPVKSKKTKIRDRYFHYLIYSNDGKTFIQQRTDKDIWQNMYQFPLIETTSNQNAEVNLIRDIQTHESGEIIHKLSHQNIHAIFHHIESEPKNPENNWLSIEWHEIHEFPLPRIIDRYLENLSDEI